MPTTSSSAREASSACSSRSTLTRPATITDPSGSSVIGSLSTSNSSLISPTISSTMSSTLTRPAVPPYSSTTTAKSCAATGAPAGGRRSSWWRGPRKPAAPAGAGGPVFAVVVDQVAHLDHPQDVVEVLAEDRRCGCTSSPASPPQLAQALAAPMATMSGRGVMTSRTSVSAKRLTRVHQPSFVRVVDGRGRHLGRGRRGTVPRSPWPVQARPAGAGRSRAAGARARRRGSRAAAGGASARGCGARARRGRSGGR